jgi:hypothetical protein
MQLRPLQPLPPHLDIIIHIHVPQIGIPAGERINRYSEALAEDG